MIERTRSSEPAGVDGDTPAAQALGTRFAVGGYPTMVPFEADGIAATRLPGRAPPLRPAARPEAVRRRSAAS